MEDSNSTVSSHRIDSVTTDLDDPLTRKIIPELIALVERFG
jgi:hypothetical protein